MRGLVCCLQCFLIVLLDVNDLQQQQHFSPHCQTSLSHNSDFYTSLYYRGLLEYDDSMHCKHDFSEVQGDLIK